MIGGLVEDQQVRLARREVREGETGALAAGEDRDVAEDLLAAEEEPREVVPRFLFTETGRAAERIDDRSGPETQLRLGEIGDARRRRARDVAVQRRELADDRADERRLPRPIRAD